MIGESLRTHPRIHAHTHAHNHAYTVTQHDENLSIVDLRCRPLLLSASTIPVRVERFTYSDTDLGQVAYNPCLCPSYSMAAASPSQFGISLESAVDLL